MTYNVNAFIAFHKIIAPLVENASRGVVPKASASVGKTTSRYAGDGATTVAQELTPSSGHIINDTLALLATPLAKNDPFYPFEPLSTALTRTSSDLVSYPKLTATEIWAGVPSNQAIVLPSSQGTQGRVFLNAGDLNKGLEPPTIDATVIPESLPIAPTISNPVSSTPTTFHSSWLTNPLEGPPPKVEVPQAATAPRQQALYSYVKEGDTLVASTPPATPAVAGTTPSVSTTSSIPAIDDITPSGAPAAPAVTPSTRYSYRSTSPNPNIAAPTPPTPAVPPVVDPQSPTLGDTWQKWAQTSDVRDTALVTVSGATGAAAGYGLAQIRPSDPLA